MAPPAPPETLGTAPDGTPIRAFRIGSAGVQARVLTLGAVVQDLRLAGHAPPLVLGYADPMAYIRNPHKLGAVVGRVANRIADGRFELDGQTYSLDRNDAAGHCLHGGADGTQVQVWQAVDHGPDHVTLAVTLGHGHMGFPGRLDARCTYRTQGAALDIELTAQSDAPTFCSLTNHSYFNLSGAPDFGDHRLTVAADSYLPLDDRQIPLGRQVPVAGDLDFRKPRPVAGAVDHTFCLAQARRPLAPAATLAAAGVSMTLSTTEPGLQVYDGAALDRTGQTGLTGTGYGPRAGLALEPQAWPDAPNQGWAAQALLRPGETYRHHSRLAFSRTA